MEKASNPKSSSRRKPVSQRRSWRARISRVPCVTDDGARVFSICCASAPNAESHTLGTKSLFTAKEKHMEHPPTHTHTNASSPPTPSPHPRPSCSPELRPVMQMRNRCVGGWRAWSRPCFHKDPRLTRSRKSCLPSSSRSKTWILFGPAALHETPAWEPGGREKKKKKHRGRNREREGGGRGRNRGGGGGPWQTGEIWTDVCWETDREVCVRLIRPAEKRPLQLPRGLSWSDPVACMENS